MYEEKPEQADAPERSSKLPLSHQEKALAELHETIGMLTRRLTPVLTPSVPSDERSMATDKSAPVQSPLADQIDANNGGIRKATNKLRALMERLEC
jgi:hypothetical protein